jgi:hypothetical protein
MIVQQKFLLQVMSLSTARYIHSLTNGKPKNTMNDRKSLLAYPEMKVDN